MTDAVASGIRPDVMGSFQQQTPAQGNKADFEAALNAADPNQVSGPAPTPPPVAADDIVRMERELQTRVLKMDRASQVQYFSEPLDVSYAAYAEIREQLGHEPTSLAQQKMVETLDRLGTDYQELSGFLQEFASGKDFTQQELLAVQIRSHQILQSVEILSKSVEQSTSGMKTIFQTNV
ncbi:MAG: hypothetical protein KDA27_09670 [Candidatus Eisenbacteria bacterium]|uniref:Uncharacterized protein n=1 Tax=Eiseniibacteriota bacterium TaxID=2212470 RepID=A0A956NBS2_UNCEI|nr:hypothetical protein [Candidatus Eisenbacteria bacterium]MCB9463946.1 hypothetical protein [Candidatus Eisenbacteria bacterium]